MLGTRVIPCLLLEETRLVKTVKFSQRRYVGDPVNTVRIFNDKGVDEIVLLDIAASKLGQAPNYELLGEIASESFVPMGYGGGLTCLDEVRAILRLGFEKVILNSVVLRNPQMVASAAAACGSQSVVVSIDVKRSWRGQPVVHSHQGLRSPITDPVALARQAVALGAGEILLNSVDRDGCMTGYDLELVRSVSSAVSVPVIACGGAASVEQLAQAVTQGGAAAVAAGSLFVFQGRHRAVLVNYPSATVLEQVFPDRICPEAECGEETLQRAA